MTEKPKTYIQSEISDSMRTKFPIAQERIGNFRRRLRATLDVLGVSNTRFAQECGLSEGAVRNYTNGKTFPDLPTLVAMANAAGVNLQWLAIGEGPMFPGVQELTDIEQKCETVSDLKAPYIAIPFYGVEISNQASEPHDAKQSFDFAEFSREWLRRELRVLPIDVCLWSIDSDTMTPTLTPGDLALIDRRKDHIGLDGVYLLSMNGSASLKRLQALPGGVVKVTHDNTVYEPFTLQLNQLNTNDIDLVGKVIWIGHQFR
jgi:phage repressor protein C with HTH and peptisase S24 domain